MWLIPSGLNHTTNPVTEPFKQQLKIKNMKKFTLLLFSVIVMINAAAQQINIKQKVTNENKTAPGDIIGNSFLNSFKQRNSVPFLFTSGFENLKSSASKIKLDSVTVTRTYDKTKNVKYFVREYKYNEEQKLSEIVEREKAPKNNEWFWLVTSKTNFKYNDAGLISNIITYISSNENSLALVELKYSYNTYGKIDSINVFLSEYQNWQQILKCQFYYNEFDKLERAELYEDWYNMGTPWAYSYHTYKYDIEGHITQYRVTGIYDILTEYKWDSSGNLVSATDNDYGWNTIGHTNYWYDKDGDRIKITCNLYWKNQVEEYTYTNVDASEILNYDYYTLSVGSLVDPVVYSPKKQISMIQSWKENGGEWSYSEKSVFFYSPINLKGEIFTSLKGINQSEICVYPNPVTDQITFAWNQNFNKLNLKLFQVTGACVMDREISSGENIPVSNLQNGMYLYKLLDDSQFVKSGKLLIE